MPPNTREQYFIIQLCYIKFNKLQVKEEDELLFSEFVTAYLHTEFLEW